jgi:hypothetical protein
MNCILIFQNRKVTCTKLGIQHVTLYRNYAGHFPFAIDCISELDSILLTGFSFEIREKEMGNK